LFSAVLYAYGGVIVRTLTPIPTPPIGSNLCNINIPFSRESYDGECRIRSKSSLGSEGTINRTESLLIKWQLLFFYQWACRYNDTLIGNRYVILAKHWMWLPDDGFIWTETCWSSFYSFNYFNNL